MNAQELDRVQACMKTIALEEHFVTRDFLKATGAYGNAATPEIAAMQPKLLDLGEGRIAAMDEGGIDLQVLSLAAMGFDDLSAETAVSLARDANDELAAAVEAHRTRFAAWALLPMKQPEKAAAELERCAGKPGFVGAMLDGTTGGLFLDDPRFTPVWETASRLGVPVYVHPAPPPKQVKEVYFAGLPEPVAQLLSIAGWGWHAETGLHTLRLICSGLFDHLPKLQVIIGHMGEGLPYALARSSGMLSGPAKLKQTVAEYFQTNLHVTTSGYFTLPPFECAREVIGLGRMMYSVDYPFSPNTRGKAFLAEAAGVLSGTEMEALTHGNAERVLKLT